MNRFKKYLSFNHFIFLGFVVFVIFNRGPVLIKNWSLKNKSIAPIQTVMTIKNETVALNQGPYALVFWSTWCKPCDLELRRVQNLIDDSKIKPEQVIAVALDNEIEPIKKAVNERKYGFHVVWSEAHQLANYYQVQGTPTVVIIGRDHKIKSVSTGISPLLELRLKKHLR